ncbi:Uncharacterised protein [BD1-7 clade bacterium]|uniref:Ferritin-like domain-containing protein n=1 Tax=BD1-7 clade bacterium TaxID=2029982 RepID=A0A5S9PL29_9GAMM|nr:Uncharacterised protein [BD1-7 clade bacterium]CAA0104859.1 Uncharacterised protein [BD1-7 clade bacterium]
MDTASMQCFPSPGRAHATHLQHPLIEHLRQHLVLTNHLSRQQRQALSRLVPLLLCGEQSAMHVFHQENDRLKVHPFSHHMHQLQQIEADEYLHEDALQQLMRQLPLPADLQKIKRRAQVFYTRIERLSHDLASHFATISQLDACVCLVMNAMANSDLEGSAVARLFELIKNDEAKHVTIAREHASQLGHIVNVDNSAPTIHVELIKLLMPEATAFEAIGIDAERLFARVIDLAEKRSPQPTHEVSAARPMVGAA